MAENKKRKVSDKKLISLFDRFDNTKALTVISEYALQRISHNPNWDVTLVDKIKKIRLFVTLIQRDLNMKYSKFLGSKITMDNSLFFYADPNMPHVFVRSKILQTGNTNIMPISLNIPLDKLITMPAMEVYAILSATAHMTVQAEMLGEKNKFANVDLEHMSVEKFDKVKELSEKRVEHQENKQKATILLTRYLEGFLPSYCGEYFTKFDNISALVANNIVDSMEPDQIEKMAGIFFDFGTLNYLIDKNISDYASIPIEELREARLGALYNKARELWKDQDRQPEAIGVTQQYQALMSDKLKSQFSMLVANQGKGLSNTIDIEAFCRNYANTYMESNGLKPIDLTFENIGELGSYIDAGTKQRININLSKISSVSELVSTLSHELTHAVESSINKSNGEQTKEGFGLADNISYDISGLSLPKHSPEYKVLRQINYYCYRLNPNERSARYGELSALKFMQSIATTEKEKEQLSNTIDEFVTYQTQTLDIIKRLSENSFMADIEKRVEEILASDIPEADKQLFRERMAYIKRMMKGQSRLEVSMENKSLQEIQKFAVKEMEQEQQMGM